MAFGEPFHIGERDLQCREGTLVGDADIEQRSGCRPQIRWAALRLICELRRRTGKTAHHFRRFRPHLCELRILGGRIAQPGLEHFRDAELVALSLPPRRWFEHPRLRREIVENVGELGSGLAVDAAMMDLVVVANLPVLQSLDHVDFPKRPAAIERARMQSRDEGIELLHRARLRQKHVAHVIIDVDVIVFDPYGVAELERHRRELTVHDPSEMNAVGDELLHLLVKVALVILGKLKQQQARDVHRRLGGLEMHERGVQRAEVFHLFLPAFDKCYGVCWVAGKS